MPLAANQNSELDLRLARQLKALRLENGLSLEALAARCGISRATLSRIENREVSPSTADLGKLCPVYGLSLSRLLVLAESSFEAKLAREAQLVWHDPQGGIERRLVSPPNTGLRGEVIECRLQPRALISYEKPPRPNLEHHLVMAQGALTLSVADQTYVLSAGDCLRYVLNGPSRFEADARFGAKYLLFMI
jgi:transcriptional regulator with XRE-family HTH domain